MLTNFLFSTAVLNRVRHEERKKKLTLDKGDKFLLHYVKI